MNSLTKSMVEICANCGKLSKASKKEFVCPDCGCNVCVVVPREIFMHMVKDGIAKQ